MAAAPTPAAFVYHHATHSHLVPYLAALHASCITNDRLAGTFVPPLSHEKLLSWWRERIAEAAAGSRVIVLFLLVTDPAARPKGPELMGVVMLGSPPPEQAESAPFRGKLQKLLVSPKYRRKGAAAALVGVLEAEAVKAGRTLLTLDVETGSGAETVFKKFGYVEVGRVPKYSRSPNDQFKDQTFFYKDLAP